MGKLNIGDAAPDFELLNQDGELVRLSDYLGKKKLVVYFYPKDETPGCTKEACGFRDEYESFTGIGAEVIGISADSVNSHKLFQLNRRLPFQLLSDPKNEVRKSFGVSSGFLGLIPGRETFVLDKEGIIRFRFSSQTQISSHIQDALEILQNLS
jgi:peroxiredoxin Q/BCP